MKNKTAKQIVQGYRLKCALVALAYAIALLVLIFFVISKNRVLGMVGVAILAYTVHTPFEKLHQKDIEGVIYEELDPEKFGEILQITRLKKSTRHKMIYYMSSGNYDEIMKLLKEIEPKSTHPIDKCNNLYRESFVYFERGEYEKLPEMFKKYERLKSNNPRFQFALENFTVFDKFDAFCDDDFEYVVDVCDIDLKELDTKKQNHNITKINVSFYRAVSLYKLERYDEAKEGFKEIIKFAPKMHKAKLSQEFVELIDKQ